MDSTYKSGPQHAPTISRRARVFQENADRTGWHLHTADSYIGYNEVLTLDAIVRQFADIGQRLTYVAGNVLMFSK